MDDGLQNPALAKDLRIAVVDGRRGIGNGEVIPAGPLRARLALQLSFTDAVVVNAPPGDDVEGEAVGPTAWLRDQFHGPVLSARPVPSGDVDWLREGPLVAYAGIANPQRFYDLLTQVGAHVVAKVSFADHHAFDEADARDLLAQVARHKARLVTTEKDWVRLLGATGALAELRDNSRPLPIRLSLDPRDDVRLEGLLDGLLKRTEAAS